MSLENFLSIVCLFTATMFLIFTVLCIPYAVASQDQPPREFWFALIFFLGYLASGVVYQFYIRHVRKSNSIGESS